MLFNSLQFIWFFIIVTISYYLIEPVKRGRQFLLLIASYYFYASWNVSYLALIIISTITTFTAALLYEKSKRRVWTHIGMILNFSILFFFKYLNWGIASVNTVLQAMHAGHSFQALDIILPIGISFYTFQAVGYLLDVTKGEVRAEKDFISYALFVSFYPQLVAGPIERTANLLPQIKKLDKIRADYDTVVSGLITMLYGFFVKIVLADRFAYVVDCAWTQYQYIHRIWLWIGAVFFSLQIYCDFLGYSTIALGAAKVMGIKLSENFQTPYFSESVREFWRRWHISLSSWFRDYVYIPLGGNRCSRSRTGINTMITFLLSGLWHGASWHFVIWGGIHGMLLLIEKRFQFLTDRIPRNAWVSFAKKCIVFLVVTAAWIFFRAPSIMDALRYMKYMVLSTNADGPAMFGFDTMDWVILLVGILFMLMIHIQKFHRKQEVGKMLYDSPFIIRWGVSLALVYLVIFCGRYGETLPTTPFLYFQF